MKIRMLAGVLASVLASVLPLRTQTPVRGFDASVTVLLQEEGETRSLSLRDYLIGVVLQEMPASFETEALKAQAVAARTFTVRCIYGGGKHENADVCGDPSCCQCFLDETERTVCYGDGWRDAEARVRCAVEETDGQVLTYGGELIQAPFFSGTQGATEDAAAVWGGEVPYLQSVSSPEEARITEVSVPLTAFRMRLPEAELRGRPEGWITEISYTKGGAVDRMRIGGVSYRGTELRRLFSLKSAKFTVSVTDSAVVFTVAGSGHGVGLSQYGADTMAARGSGYAEILLHYYAGAELQELY